MSMIGEMTFFLGLHVNQSPCGIFINQSNYVNEILRKYGLNTCDIIGTPMDIKDKLDLDQIGTLVDATKYRSMIGAHMYLTSSRPDIIHATCDYGFELTGFSDADYARCKDTFKSTSGGAHFLGEKLMSMLYLFSLCSTFLFQNQMDLPKDTPIDRLEVFRYDIEKRSKVRMGIMSTETELALEQTQQDRHHGPSDAMHNPPHPLKSKIKILDHKHVEGTAKNSQDNKVLRLEVKTYAMTTPLGEIVRPSLCEVMVIVRS
nr:hypothetical protein [Tanacetum cinerariifolium]